MSRLSPPAAELLGNRELLLSQARTYEDMAATEKCLLENRQARERMWRAACALRFCAKQIITADRPVCAEIDRDRGVS